MDIIGVGNFFSLLGTSRERDYWMCVVALAVCCRSFALTAAAFHV